MHNIPKHSTIEIQMQLTKNNNNNNVTDGNEKSVKKVYENQEKKTITEYFIIKINGIKKNV